MPSYNPALGVWLMVRSAIGVAGLCMCALAPMTAHAASPKVQVGATVTAGVVLGKKPTITGGVEVSGAFLFRGSVGSRGPYAEVFARARWTQMRDQQALGGGLRVGRSFREGHVPDTPPGCSSSASSWTPLLAAAGELGFYHRRVGGPSVAYGAQLVGTGPQFPMFLGGSVTAETALKRDSDVDGAWSGPVQGLHVEGRTGVWAIPNRATTVCLFHASAGGGSDGIDAVQ